MLAGSLGRVDQNLFYVYSATVLLIMTACTDAGPRDTTAKIDTLESGAVLVSNGSVGAWGRRPAWHLTDEVKIGTRDSEGPDVFGRVADIELDPIGRVYVLDFHAQAIRVFEADGSYVRSLGRPGAGPGEFRSAMGMRFDPQGRLWVANQNNQRYSIFDTSGVLLKELPRRTSTTLIGYWPAAFTAAGDLYDWQWRYDESRAEFVDTLHHPGVPVGVPMGWAYSVVTREGWWVGAGSEYRLWHISFAGDTVAIVEREHELTSLPAEQRDSMEAELRRLEQRAGRNLDMAVPRHQRIFNWMVLDDRDYLWVLLSPERDDQGTTLDVFDPAGRFLGGLHVAYAIEPQPPPSSGPPPVIRGNTLAFVTKDEFDVQYVVILRIAGRR